MRMVLVTCMEISGWGWRHFTCLPPVDRQYIVAGRSWADRGPVSSTTPLHVHVCFYRTQIFAEQIFAGLRL